MEDKFVLASTQKGFVDQYIWSLLWIFGFFAATRWLSGHIDSIYAKSGVNSFSEFENLSYYYQESPFELLLLVYAGVFISYIIAGILVLCNMYTFVYSTRRISTFFKSGEDFWNKVINENYDFPSSKMTQQVVFDRIVAIKVQQGTISRVLNTGTLSIKMITFTNADSKEQEWSIPAIKSPYERKRELEAALAGHEGLIVKLFPGQEESPAF